MLPQVTFRGVSPSAEIVETVWRKAKKLWELEPSLSGCQVVIEAEARAQRAMAFRVTVQLLGGTRASHRGARHATGANVHIALRDAFRATWRQLEGRHKRTRPRADASGVWRVQRGQHVQAQPELVDGLGRDAFSTH